MSETASPPPRIENKQSQFTEDNFHSRTPPLPNVKNNICHIALFFISCLCLQIEL